MAFTSIVMIPVLILSLAVLAGGIYLAVLVIRALRKYLRSGEVRREKSETRRSLGETIKAHRMRCQMTQEFVAESLGVSRQAVSRWETGTADPSTSNLIALAKLFDVSPAELLRETAGGEGTRAFLEAPVTICNGTFIELWGKFPWTGSILF